MRMRNVVVMTRGTFALVIFSVVVEIKLNAQFIEYTKYNK